jgi:hypothetical protein
MGGYQHGGEQDFYPAHDSSFDFSASLLASCVAAL